MLRRIVMAGVVVGVLAFSLVLHKPSSALATADGAQTDGGGRKEYRRRASFKFVNSTKPEQGRDYVSGKGSFPIRLKVFDEGNWRTDRRIQVFVAIYVVDGDGGLWRVWTAKNADIMTTAAEEEKETSFEWDVPLLPGKYVAYVYLCDPDRPYNPAYRTREDPEPEEFPGAVVHAKSIEVRVISQ